MLRFVAKLATGAAVLALSVGAAQAQTRVTLKSASAGSSYYLMTVQLGEVLRAATDGDILPTVEESQGSVQNVKEAARRGGAFVFTSPPSLVQSAQAGKAPFEGESGYDAIRTLFVMPPITMHFVVGGDGDIEDIADLEGKTFVAGGRGTFTERQTTALFEALGLDGKVEIVDVELNAAVGAMRNRQIDGFATGSSHPTSSVQELAATMPIRLLSLTPEQFGKMKEADAGIGPVTIAAGTYPDQDAPVATFGVPVGAYATAGMDDETAYRITKTVWEQIDGMAAKNPWWNAIAPEQVAAVGIALHPGAARYYQEAGIAMPESMR